MRPVRVAVGLAAAVVTGALVTGAVLTGLEVRELGRDVDGVTALAGDTRVQDGSAETLAGLDDSFAEIDRASFRVRSAQEAARSTAFDVEKIATAAAPSVVQVTCGDVVGSGYVTDGVPADGFGSMVVTSMLVVDACTYDDGPTVQVSQGGAPLASEIWSWDEANAVALVMVGPELPPLTDALGPSYPGSEVVAIGSALGIESTVTSGVVSNVGDLLVQTDAVLNPGSEGGPLLDASGRVLGISTLGSGGEGIGFAVRLKVLCAELLECDPRVMP